MLPTYETVDGETKESLFLGFVTEHRAAIENEIFKFIPRSDSISPLRFGLEKHWKMVVAYPERGGKYIRPGLLLLSAYASGGDIGKAMTTAAAMEVSENWLLIHDDFEDHSLQRRGKPTLSELHGDEMAVNAGDHLHLIMWKILLENRNILENEKAFEVADEMVRFLQTTCEGQYLELGWTRGGRIVGEEEYFEMVDRKTGWYTIIGPLRLGALVADNEGALEPLVNFGHALGRAFQLHDDWLNVFSTKTGKELGGDILEGKRTLLLARLVDCLERSGDGDNLDYVKKVYSMTRDQKNDEMVKAIINLYEDHECRQWVRASAKDFAERAIQDLEKVPYSEEGKRILTDAVDFIVNREL
ncbi:MAG: polyprenyl synthetase family protein [Planctomycetota bacterium]|jgi:geranylgeranyl diphosphate synthase type II